MQPTKFKLDVSLRLSRPGGFTLIELLVATVIIAVLVGLAAAGGSAMMQQARKTREISAAKSLITAYLLHPVDYNGKLMVAHYEGSAPDLDRSEFRMPDGKRIDSASLHRYPYRIAPYLDYSLDGTILVNRNSNQIEKVFPGNQFDYGVSLCPALGINYYYVGGYSVDGEIAGEGECVTHLQQGLESLSILTFASAFTEIGEDRIEGRYGVEPPRYRSQLWDKNLHVDARYSGKAVCAFLDGSVRMHTIDELRDMRLWSMNAVANDDPNYTVKVSGSSGIGGGSGGRK